MPGVLTRFRRAIIRSVCIAKPQSLWKRYALGLFLVCLTISVAHYASFVAIGNSDRKAEASQISNRQVKLSQRILFLTRESAHTGSAETESRLQSAVHLFEASHAWLVDRADLSPELRHLYFQHETFPLDHFSRQFVDVARQAIDADGQAKLDLQDQMVSLGQTDLLAALRQAAALHETRADEQIKKLQRLETIALAVAFFVLMMEALFIFLPAQVSVSRTIRRLERRSRQLAKSHDALRQRNTDLVAARNNLAHAANHDALTGLLNRRALHDCLSVIGEEATGEVDVSVLKVDLDRFKAVNDSLGHKAGDDVLTEVARLLLTEVRSDDLVARIGGDEFAIVVKGPKSVEALENLGDRIVRAIGQPMDIRGTRCQIGASVGFTMATSEDATPDQLLIEADLALYQAKRNGRGQVFAFSERLRTDFENRRVLFAQIDTALSQDQFEPHFQPQICCETGQLYGCEVLARWRHPERGIVSPATFIAAAEEAGLIRHIDLIMVEKGLDALEDLRARGYAVPSISVNAAPATLRDPDLPDRLLQEVLVRGLSPSDLTVEILENTLVCAHDDTVIRTVEQLTGIGFSVVLDDFGTGYASMSNLSHLKIDGIKLDQSLVQPIPDARAEAIVHALVTLSRSLNMRVVAEGVETPTHFSRMTDLGCDVLQGFIIGHPMDVEGFAAWYEDYTCPQERSA
ncbi:hypothetical protein So717_34270 [Roseobacter cerasinus]|uniref:Diguanylate cyclase/phosphodiesterase n=1 Tax=Roseobacter cerasinus TaxID=2602289 RepID=A0A640VVP9_9RHOB|nr:EAL domain-containing protein [Roseobacter cerasinus]GFE51674.1 hypothetical protein So717_34270 [Roseobacter cerasinus]